MNFVADESVDQDVVDSLRKAGHDIVAIAETHPGISDQAVLKLANDHGALLLPQTKISVSSSSARVSCPKV